MLFSDGVMRIQNKFNKNLYEAKQGAATGAFGWPKLQGYE